MKKVFVLLFIFPLFCSGQQPKDTIMKKTGELILCEITFINNDNIFYNQRIKGLTENFYISQKDVAYFKLAPGSKPERLDSAYRKTIIKKDSIVIKTNDTIKYLLKTANKTNLNTDVYNLSGTYIKRSGTYMLVSVGFGIIAGSLMAIGSYYQTLTATSTRYTYEPTTKACYIGAAAVGAISLSFFIAIPINFIKAGKSLEKIK